MAEERGPGSAACPWTIEALPGQRINITLYNFAYITGVGDGPSGQPGPMTATGTGGGNGGGASGGYVPAVARPDVCFEVAVVTDGDVKKTVTVCEGDQRESTVTLSKTNRIQIEITNPRLLRTIGAFLFKYKGTLCRRHGTGELNLGEGEGEGSFATNIRK